ncbi:MAG: RNA polymerase sigma factor [Odoribacter splanchnicus]
MESTQWFDKRFLVSELGLGNEKALKVLFETFYPSLCLFAGNYLKNEFEAADIVQESFLKYWNRRKDFDSYASIKSFLYIVVQHACLNFLRDNRYHASLCDIDLKNLKIEGENYLIEEEAHRIFNLAVDQLPKQQRMVIQYVLEGLNTSEIAIKMNLTKNSVITYKKEAYKRLRLRMKDSYYLLMIFSFIDR